ncbi:winged helix-turn-helix domain-containing protein [Bradyrhizobium canariense]|uniref:TolB amino-terminal domain-containing protein n=1 Tax=Bradyrhizobium canariense TaxID=255045 RepID=A0A1H2BSJ3_9BRAD|nr:winged helix-turn-helix domain-containing tetratricopeptide repeat protein [Bradyrhizobium canariense]SDT61178.1 TolB amino-terminal domain-containing protein [Bradyrhizobium canariense]
MQFLFSNHVLDADLRELSRGNERVAVEPQVFDLLIYLVENRDRVVTKDDLIAKIWDGRIVSESTLTSRINAARKAVGDSGRDQGMIRTIARKGFRFVGEVRAQNGGVEPRDHLSQPPSQTHEPSRHQMPSLDRTAIAVLPFTNMSGEHEQEYFSEGISEDIITALSKLRWFYVIARNSSFVYKGSSVHLKQIGEELGVGYVVEGSVRKDGDHVRITAQLNDVVTGSHIWAERYDRNLADVFAVQDDITQSVVAAIEPQLYAAENFRAQRKAPDNLDAWDLVMRALSHYWRVTRQDNLVAQAFLEKAISFDPDYGQALGLLAASHTFGAHMGWENMKEAVPIAERAALAAIHADSEDPWAHNALASVYLFNRRFDDCIAEFELTLRLNPNFSPARGYYGVALAYCGRWEEGDRAARHALRLSPRDPFSAIYCGVAAYSQFVGRNYEEAIRLSREALRQRSDFVGAHRVLTAAAGMAGLEDIAKAALQELRRVQPNVSLSWISGEMPFKCAAERDHYLDGFRRAGLS